MSSSFATPTGAESSASDEVPTSLPDDALRVLGLAVRDLHGGADVRVGADGAAGATPPHVHPRAGHANSATSASKILRRWEQVSSATVWLKFGEWRNEAVDALASAMAESRCARAAVARLGEQRAHEGVGLRETLADLHCALTAGGYLEFESDLVSEAAQHWADAYIDPATRIDWVDPISGLVNSDYLEIRLHELYERFGAEVATKFCLVVVDGQVQGASTWSRDARDMILGQAVRRACKRGQTKVKLINGTILILEERDEGFTDRFDLVKEVVSDHARSAHAVQIRRPARLWIEGLPSSLDSARDLLRSMST